MLVLSRKDGQRVMIGPDVVVTVLEIRGDTVKLGFDAPSEVRILREEVRRRIGDENPTTANPRSPSDSCFFAECA
jgi:carbon storage regulator